LLDVLAGRKESGRITGEILINGNKPDITYTRYSAYVTQTDILFPTYTVGECVRFSAMCRLPEAVSTEEKNRFAEQILIDLDLKKIENKVVGIPGSGISPEQRKRLNLAVELAANPQLIFLDEVIGSVVIKVVSNLLPFSPQQDWILLLRARS
jgi:ABC-type multidrug transport system ATPase subunit